jgi:hypothetical protein
MNERLKELMLEAGYAAPELAGRGQKLAELIVRECISTLKQMHLHQSLNNQNYPSAWHDAVDQSIDNIKEYFGVEE